MDNKLFLLFVHVEELLAITIWWNSNNVSSNTICPLCHWDFV